MAGVPSYEKTTALVARALGWSPHTLAESFRPATRADLPGLLRLRASAIGADLIWNDEAYLRWRYRFSPDDAGRGDCWVSTREGEVIGALGTEDIVLRHGETSTKALSMMDIMVRPDFDGLGLGPWMAMDLCRRTDAAIAIGSNPHSRAIVSKVLTRMRDRRCYDYVVRFHQRFYRSLGSHIASAALAMAAEQTMRTWRALTIPWSNGTLELRPIERFDRTLDELCTRAHNPREISIARTREFLNWRLFDNPRASYQVWGAFENDVLEAYMAVRTGPLANDQRELILEDWLNVPDEEGTFAFRVLLGTAIEFARDTGCAHVSVITSHEASERVLRRIGFREIHNEWETLSACTTKPELNAAFESHAPWHVTGVNTDRDI
jgi:GNAT superfamily N-acetyltransferase